MRGFELRALKKPYPAQIGRVEIGAIDHGLEKIGALEACTGELGAAEIGAAKIGVPKVGAGKIGSLKTQAAQAPPERSMVASVCSARQAFHAWAPCFSKSICSLFAIFLLRDQVKRQARMGIADRVHDLLYGQSPHIPQIGARQIGAVKRRHPQISTAEIGAVE